MVGTWRVRTYLVRKEERAWKAGLVRKELWRNWRLLPVDLSRKTRPLNEIWGSWARRNLESSELKSMWERFNYNTWAAQGFSLTKSLHGMKMRKIKPEILKTTLITNGKLLFLTKKRHCCWSAEAVANKSGHSWEEADDTDCGISQFEPLEQRHSNEENKGAKSVLVAKVVRVHLRAPHQRLVSGKEIRDVQLTYKSQRQKTRKI